MWLLVITATRCIIINGGLHLQEGKGNLQVYKAAVISNNSVNCTAARHRPGVQRVLRLPATLEGSIEQCENWVPQDEYEYNKSLLIERYRTMYAQQGQITYAGTSQYAYHEKIDKHRHTTLLHDTLKHVGPWVYRKRTIPFTRIYGLEHMPQITWGTRRSTPFFRSVDVSVKRHDYEAVRW